MNSPILSICIPTFNRAKEIKQCLDSIVNNNIEEIEIVVSDNASNDETIDILKYYSKVLPLRWITQKTNIGFDRNCAEVVSMARGKYCWILGSDDAIVFDGIKISLDEIKKNEPDILHFGYIQADSQMRQLYGVKTINKNNNISTKSDDYINYLNGLGNLSLAFFFISCFIFRKSRWDSFNLRMNYFIDSNYVHTLMIHSIASEGSKITSIENCLVVARHGHNEWNSVPGRFLEMDSTTIIRVCNEIYNDKRFINSLGYVFRKSYSNYQLFLIAINGGVEMINYSNKNLVTLGCSVIYLSFIKALNRLHVFKFLRIIYSTMKLLKRVVIRKSIM